MPDRDVPLGEHVEPPPPDVETVVQSDIPSAPPESARRNRFNLRGRSLRQHAARGALINAAFMIGLSLLGFVKGFVLAGLLSPRDYGIFGVLAVSLGTILWLKQIGVGDKYIQQDEDDQEAAFHSAFTFEVITTGVFLVILVIALPLFCILYGEWELLAPGLVIVLVVLPSGVLRTPLWVYYRRMEFLRQRLLQAIDPVVGFAVAVGMAIAGFGYWALIGGMVAGGWATAIAALWHAPYRLRLRVDRQSVRDYWSFSWPLLVTSGGSMLIAQSAVIAAELHLGLAAVGAIALASNITNLTNRIDGLVTGTLYPAIVAVKDRTDLLYESFVKSNRLALMWAMPFGIALSLFSGDLVSYVIGEKWRPAVTLLQVYGVVAAIGHIAFNWDAYMKAIGDTRPMAVASGVTAATFVLAGVPLLLAFDLPGLAAGVALQSAVHIAVRAYYLRRVFHGFRYLSHASRAMLPTVPAALLVLLLRVIDPLERSLSVALAELALYGIVTIAMTVALERPLLREIAAYLAPRRFGTAGAA